MDENKDNNQNKKINNQGQIAGAIVIAGVLIAGAILLKDSSAPAGPVPISKQIGLNVKKFNSCMESGRWADKVEADIEDGAKAGVNGTPTSFIVKNGVVVDMIGGAQPYEVTIKQIDDAMNNEKEPFAIVEDPMASSDLNPDQTPKYVEIKPVSQDDHIIGDLNAKIIVVEYSDLDCPFCKVFHNTMHRVIEEKDGDVAWVYRHYPIPQLHPDAFKKAEETECAWELGGNEAFWKYADKVFETAS